MLLYVNVFAMLASSDSEPDNDIAITIFKLETLNVMSQIIRSMNFLNLPMKLKKTMRIN